MLSFNEIELYFYFRRTSRRRVHLIVDSNRIYFSKNSYNNILCEKWFVSKPLKNVIMFILFYAGKGTITVPSGALNDGQWHFIEITRNGRRVKVNVDRRMAGIKEHLLNNDNSPKHVH